MGEVYRAHDSRLDRDVALKLLPAHALGDETARARLLREARLASKLNHPHICTIFDVGETEGRTYIAMELVEGRTLAARIADGPMPVANVVRYGQQLSDALDHAHARGVIHRDLKSANIIVTPDGQVKVLDFGLAKQAMMPAIADAETMSRQLTAPGMVAGTLAYMAPEQLRGQPADTRSDIWSLGVVLHEMASGSRPFGGATAYEVMGAILNSPPRAASGSLPNPVMAVIDRCLAKDPGERYQRAGEVRAALDVLASGAVVAAPPARLVRPGRRRAMLAGSVVAGVLLLIAATLFILNVGGVRARLVGTSTESGEITLAVLPFTTLTANPDQDYLTDGLTEAMITQLGQMHPDTLRVKARTSIMRYKKARPPLQEIGRDLNVAYVLDCSVQREGSRVRVTAALIKVADQTEIWAKPFDHEWSGIFALQSDVAREVANGLAVKLLPAERARLQNARPVNPEAYEAYLQGMHYWQDGNEFDKALRYFELAREKDPDYPLAYVGIARVWVALGVIGGSAEAGLKAKAAALKALQLDDNLAEAHFALAAVKNWVEWDWPAADASFKRAIALNPSFSEARAFYSHYLHQMGRPAEAMAQIQRALELDPFNSLCKGFYAQDLLYEARYDEIIAMVRSLPTSEADNQLNWNALWAALSAKGQKRQALEAARNYVRWNYGDPAVDAAIVSGFAAGGYEQAMRSGGNALATRLRTSHASTFDIAEFFVEAGDTTEALNWLERGYATHDPGILYMGTEPFVNMRSEPRYQALLRRLRLPL